MLTIKNITTIKVKEFSCLAKQWILYGVDASKIEYKFIFMPMDYQTKVFNISKAQLVLLDRNKKLIGSEVLGYRLWTTDGRHIYLNTNDIRNWTELVQMVIKHKMIYANNT